MVGALLLGSGTGILGLIGTKAFGWGRAAANIIAGSVFLGSMIGAVVSSFMATSSSLTMQQSTFIIGAESTFEAGAVSYIFIILTALILFISTLASWYTTVNYVAFYTLLVIINLCLVGAFSCTNLFTFLAFFELSALPVFVLVAYCGSSRRERIKAAYYFLFFTLYGSLSLLVVIIGAYSLNNIEFLHANTVIGIVAYGLLFVSFAAKVPLFPFHIWLPYAHVEASTVSSIILAALLLKLGGYGLIRFLVPAFGIEVSLYYRPIIIVLAIIGFIYGSLCATRQIDLKRQIAFSSIAHMSFAIVGLYMLLSTGIDAAIFLMFSHGLISSALFFLVGALSDRYHTRSVTAFSGLLGLMPLFAGFLLVAILANVGFPGTSGFIPELLILIAVFKGLPSIIIVILFGMVITTLSNLVIPLRVLFGHAKLLISGGNWADLTRLEAAILSLLVALVIGFGFINYRHIGSSESYFIITSFLK